MAWQLSGQYLETCNCEVLCPCLLTLGTGKPTEGHCDAVLGFYLEKGAFDEVDLSGLKAAVALQTEGPMANGRGRREVYVDTRATEAQRQALAVIFGGEAGGRPELIAQVAPDLMGVKYAEIEFAAEGESRILTVAGVGEMSVTGLRGAGGTMHITNASHPVSRTLALARASEKAVFKDNAFSFDNAGRNGHFGTFEWSG